jgi:hypothetical protein
MLYRVLPYHRFYYPLKTGVDMEIEMFRRCVFSQRI